MKCPKCGIDVSDDSCFCENCGTKIIQEEKKEAKADKTYQHNISTIWPEWQIEKVLGRGSFGIVYQAIRQDTNIVSRSAIKVISIPQDSNEVDSLRSEGLTVDDSRTYYKGIVDDFVNEIQVMESFKGTEHIVSVEDYKVIEKSDDIGWDIYIRMELLTPFNTYLINNALTEEQVVQLGVDICDALEKCNQRNIIHRDIKPENIFINDFGAFKLGDFGIARKMENMTTCMSQKGTYNYMAPEVFKGAQYDDRADIYSLGIVLYRLLNDNHLPGLNTSQQLLDANERKSALERRLSGESLPAPCKASEGMANIILKACSYDASTRFNSASEMKKALLDFKAGVYMPVESDLDKTTFVNRAAVQAPVEVNVEKETKEIKKKSKAPLIIIILLLVAAIIAGGIFFIYPRLSKDDAADSQAESTEIKDNEEKKVELDKDYSRKENKQITQIIEEAESLAATGDYAGALSKIENGLITYSLSERLKAEAEEYKTLLAAQEKEKVLAEAKSYADNSNYESAIYLLRDMLSNTEDADYRAAYASYCDAYEEAVLESAYNKTSDSLYDEAIQDVTDALKVLPESEELKAAKESYYTQKMESIKANALAEAESYSQRGDYMQALDTVNRAMLEVGQDEALKNAAKNYEDAYVQVVIAQADQKVQNQDVEAAKTVIDDALTDLPYNTTLTDYRTDLDRYKSVPLHTLEMHNTMGKFSTKYWNWNNGKAMDKMGNDYSTALNYVVPDCYYGTGAEYKVDKQYSTISFKAAPHADCSTRADTVAWINIYADNVIRYSIPAITYKSEIIEVKNVDISDAEYIKIEVICEVSTQVILADVVLNTIPGYVSNIDHSYTPLNLVKCISEYSWDWNYKRPYDMLGSDYTYMRNYMKSNSRAQAEFALDKQYESLSFDIAPVNYSNRYKTKVYVYADDVVVYTSPEITYKTAKFNTGEIDISGASFIKILIDQENLSCSTILSDMVLKKAIVDTAESTTETVTE